MKTRTRTRLTAKRIIAHVKKAAAKQDIKVGRYCDQCGVARSTMTRLIKGERKTVTIEVAERLGVI